jgi:hypothetical protein
VPISALKGIYASPSVVVRRPVVGSPPAVAPPAHSPRSASPPRGPRALWPQRWLQNGEGSCWDGHVPIRHARGRRLAPHVVGKAAAGPTSASGRCTPCTHTSAPVFPGFPESQALRPCKRATQWRGSTTRCHTPISTMRGIDRAPHMVTPLWRGRPGGLASPRPLHLQPNLPRSASILIGHFGLRDGYKWRSCWRGIVPIRLQAKGLVSPLVSTEAAAGLTSASGR